MGRIRYAILIIAALIVIILFGNMTVRKTTEQMIVHLEQIQKQCNENDYSQANIQLGKLLQYYQEKEHLLTLFIKRDYLAGIQVSISGLSAYAQQDNLQDLNSEIDKAKAQILTMEHLFFSLL